MFVEYFDETFHGTFSKNAGADTCGLGRNQEGVVVL